MLAGLAIFGALFGLLMLAHRDISVAGRLVVGSGTAVGLASPLAFVIAATMFLAFFAMAERRIWQVAVFSFALLFDIYVAVTSGTRGVFVSAFVGIVTFVMLGMKNIRPATIFGSILATFGALWYVFPMLLGDSVFTTGLLRLLTNIDQGGVILDPSALDRLERFRAAWAMFRESPFFGTGMGAFDALTGLGYPHNIVLELLSEQGVVGLVFFLGFIAAILWRSAQILKRPGLRGEAAVLIALFLAELAYLNLSMTLWMAKPLFLLGGLVSSARMHRRTNDPCRNNRNA
ncbi:MAG: hypothetical protein KatS3mg119_1949 [Rhodothalassiaceae bacterium]|nr:MAG: hypothetical protein KatS3mg119_1949 [Rhodothalassiaceae bacterium]